MPDQAIRVADHIHQALESGRPVVALESTVISHGLPWPTNFETATEIEHTVRAAGAEPATIAVINGIVRIGLDAVDDLERLAHGTITFKASPRDLPWLIAQQATAGTTVAGTMFVAHAAGISIMATGGIGGVHRGAEESGDISADLVELARTPVAVVCSGAKSILDLPRTLEYLETLGVPIIGFGTGEWPAFLTATSGLSLDCRVETAGEAAQIIARSMQLGLRRGVIVAQPPPASSALARQELEQAIGDALVAARRAHVSGKAVTPYLLEQVQRATGGRAIAANRALLVQNAKLAAEIACALRSAGSTLAYGPSRDQHN